MDALDPRTNLTPLGSLCVSLRDAVAGDKALTSEELNTVIRLVRLLLRFGADANPSNPYSSAAVGNRAAGEGTGEGADKATGFQPLKKDGTAKKSKNRAMLWEPPLHSVAAAANLGRLYGEDVGKKVHRIMRTLLMAGADPNVPNGQGKTALMCCST